VRFAGCDLDCVYCDEPAARSGGEPAALGRIKRTIRRLAFREKALAVSFTGGEPLLQPAALRELALFSRSLGLAVHLETNGVRYRELAEVLGAVDVVAADIKLPGPAGPALWREHKKFLALAPGKTFVKVVVTSGTVPAEFRRAAALAASVCGRMPFFIQPVTPTGRSTPPSAEQLDGFYRFAAGKLEDVRILPQLHPLWGIK
jgi:7-carboxy-7-deazaguanine synthase